MAPFSGDGVLWVCLGVSLALAARGIIFNLREVSDLTEIKPAEKEDKIISEGTEEFLNLDTLLSLADCPSYELRSAALRIISQRPFKNETHSLLLKDLASSDRERRNKAVTALHFLTTHQALSRTTVCAYLHGIETFNALTDCLRNFLIEHIEVTTDTTSPILPKTRPLGELKALKVLNVLLPGNVHNALEAGLISRWLINYPFPCLDEDYDPSADSPSANNPSGNNTSGNNPSGNDPSGNSPSGNSSSRRTDVVTLMKMWWADDPVMSSIFETLADDEEACKQLRAHGLMDSTIAEQDPVEHEERSGYDDDFDDDEDDTGVWTDGDVRMVNGEDTAGPDRGAVPLAQRNRELAQRHRHAVVMTELGPGPWDWHEMDVANRPYWG